MIPVVCTGKGSHRELFIRRFDFLGDWRDISKKPYKPLASGYTFTCRRCGRAPEMSAETLRTALDGLRAAGEPKLDISLLPF